MLTLLLSPVPPTFLVKITPGISPTNFDLYPPVYNVPLEETSPGVVCINCSAIGYPNLQYTWTYTDYGGDWKNVSSDSCMMFQDDQSEVYKEVSHFPFYEFVVLLWVQFSVPSIGSSCTLVTVWFYACLVPNQALLKVKH